MGAARLTMRKIRDILRLKWSLGVSHRRVAESLGVGVGTVAEALGRAAIAGLSSWAEVEGLDEVALENRLYGDPPTGSKRPLPDFCSIHKELHRKGVTLELLHLEYLEKYPSGYRYTQFCEHYGRWVKRQRRSMRHVHRAGEKMFADYSGSKPHYVEPSTGEMIEAELFVAALGASNYTFAEATRSQSGEDWIASHVRAFEYFGGVPRAVVPDQLKSGVTRPCRYEPGVQRTYEEMGAHYGTVVLPARPRSPKDKAKAEVAVQIAQRWILARLRNRTFFSLAELNAAIRELLENLNARRMRVYGASRRELFLSLEKPALTPLPSQRFEYATWKRARVNIDYHVELDRHYYSVPHLLVHEMVEIRATNQIVEVLHRGVRVASHTRSFERGRHTTHPSHMPKSHRQHLEWSPSRLIRWGEKIGPATGQLVEAILSDRPHPEQGYRSCLGILRLEKGYGAERLEAACARALLVRARSYRHVEAILKNGLDRVGPPIAQPAQTTTLLHENIRGSEYYQ
jgi:transposase